MHAELMFPLTTLGAHSHITLLLLIAHQHAELTHTLLPHKEQTTHDRQTRQSSERAKQKCSVISGRRGGPPQEKPVQSCHCCNTAEAGGGLCCADMPQKGVFLCGAVLQACSQAVNCKTVTKNRQKRVSGAFPARWEAARTRCALCALLPCALTSANTSQTAKPQLLTGTPQERLKMSVYRTSTLARKGRDMLPVTSEHAVHSGRRRHRTIIRQAHMCTHTDKCRHAHCNS
jgi:hypothetical protein